MRHQAGIERFLVKQDRKWHFFSGDLSWFGKWLAKNDPNGIFSKPPASALRFNY